LDGISPSQGHYLHRTQTQNKHRQTSVSRKGFEPTIPAFARVKTFHALDSAAIDPVAIIIFRGYSIGIAEHKTMTLVDNV
jgi:hypothetical protein